MNGVAFELLGIAEVGRELGISEGAVKHLFAQGKLSGCTVARGPNYRTRLISRESLDEYLAKQAQKAANHA